MIILNVIRIHRRSHQ